MHGVIWGPWVGVGGGSGEVDGRENGTGREGTALFLFTSPRGRFGTVMMGYGRCVGGGVVLLTSPSCTNPPTPPLLSLSFSLPHTHARERFLCYAL